MPTQIKTVALSVIGANAGPFNITDDLGNTLATNLTRQQLLDGVDVAIDDNATLITITSVGSKCTNNISLSYNSGTNQSTFSVMAATSISALQSQIGNVYVVRTSNNSSQLTATEVLYRQPQDVILGGYLYVVMYNTSTGFAEGEIFPISDSTGLVGTGTGIII